ncbi:hypothetical protein CVS40_11354 [Lucilia cuprina]|nr:hypothetical protein CVS40_11354 [Lucilia cuprina]
MPRTTMNSQNANNSTTKQNVSTPVRSTTSTASTVSTASTAQQNPLPRHNPLPDETNFPEANRETNPQMISLTERQFSILMGNFNPRQDNKSTFSSCSARFNGGRSATKVEDFIATVLVFKEAENVSDTFALLSLPLLLEGYASTWWQGVKHEAKTFEEAISLLRNAFSPPKPDWRIFAEIFQDKQKPNESTDSFVCKKRLFAQLKERISEKTKINMIFSQITVQVREKISRDSIETFQDLLNKAREIELTLLENSEPIRKNIEPKEKTNSEHHYWKTF